ncbi:hypothetical protein AVEN_244650-1 [Araneus ventricosus]|uniref:Uncharacterized protein n=1 Tax=Araneus ventricosus TaxID=182803 RepID=A0A4Y2D3H1_ARAVE|nr:hypothetical protein AVEN_244650-1 [Araneus ventricosus]
MRESSERPFMEKTAAVRIVQISLKNFHPLSLSVIVFIPAVHTFLVRMARPDGFGEKGFVLRIRPLSSVIVVFEDREVNFPYHEIGARAFPYFQVILFQWSWESEG